MIQDILPRYQEVATGSKTAFTFPFDVIKQDFIEVYLGTTKVTTGWTLSEKTITFTTAPEDGVVVTIYRNIPIEWVETNLGSLGQAGIENIGTYLVAQIQAIEEGLSRAIQTRITDTDKGEDISDDYLNSLAQATSLYGQCETLLEEIESTGEGDLEDMAEILQEVKDYRDEVIGMISTDTNLGNSDTVVPSQKAVKTYVDTGLSAKANDSDVVHNTGTETITGNKMFTENLIRMNTNITKGTNPSSQTYCTVEFTDKNGSGTKNRVGLLESAIKTNGDIETLIGAYKYENNSTTVEKISVTYPKTGNPYTFAPRPTDTTTSSGTQIATTGWVNSGSNNVVHKSADETIAGTKTFTETTSGANLVQSTSATPTGSYVDFVQQINGSRRGTIRTTYNSDGSYSITLGCNGPDAAVPTGVVVKRTSTTTTVTAPTPAVSDNSTKIATTAYVSSKYKKVSTLPASPDSNITYFIPE